MDWDKQLKERYALKGWEAFRTADESFKQRLEAFCAHRGILVVDDNPEGQDWMILLKSGDELYMDRRSYEISDGGTFWIEYKPELGGITAEFFDANGLFKEYEIVIPKSEISAVSDDWR